MNTKTEQQETIESPYSVELTERRIKRVDKLAQERTFLANRRTLLAYARTAFSIWLVGLALLKFFDEPIYLVLGAGAMVAGCIIIVTGYRYYRKEFERIRAC